MDPTQELTRIGNTIQVGKKIPDIQCFQNTEYVSLSNHFDIKFERDEEIYRKTSNYVKADEYTDLNPEKDNVYGHPKFGESRSVTNPFDGVDLNFLMNRASMKIANIDAVLDITKYNRSSGLYQDSFPFRFADLCGGPGGFSQYVMWRNQQATGSGITLKNEVEKSVNWRLNLLDSQRFKAFNGVDGTGDVYNIDNCNSFVDRHSSYDDETLLVMADGGIESDNKKYLQEVVSIRIAIAQVYMALRIINEGGDFVLKIFDTITDTMAELIFILSTQFKKIVIFKPITSRPANAERYLVCKDFEEKDFEEKDDLLTIVDKLGQVLSNYNTVGTDMQCSKLIKNIPDSSFVEYFTQTNMINYSRQKTTLGLIDSYNKTRKSLPSVYLKQRCLSLWNIPETKL
jgi:23S rRNA U2552 (ribose-2'-O)-methylase RlmE/FtsJ